jgi:predicted GNAT superfamily acetyltransferase
LTKRKVRPVVTVRELHGRDELSALLDVFDRVWQLAPASRPVGKDALTALHRAGSPLLGAWDGDRMVGGSLGFVGVDAGGHVHVHSHMTGVLPELQHRRIGRDLKLAQRDWALARGIGTVTWTFDPLVARNAWFNLQGLGAVATEYLVDFYGPIDDAINGGEETDRLLVVWDLGSERVTGAAASGAAAAPDTNGAVLVEVPADIVAVRHSDPALARAWRLRLRDELAPLLLAGGTVLGMASPGVYVVAAPR